jgi:transposase
LKRWLPERLVFIDETGVNLSLVRTHGRAPRGEPVVDRVTGGTWKNYTVIAGLRSESVIAPLVFSGALNTQALRVWVEKVLLPELSKGDIVVWDNLSVHKDSVVAALFKEHGVLLRFTPAYSPDLNPIEMTWSTLKSILRKLRAHTFDTLVDALGVGLKAISSHNCLAWFKHVGCRV